MTKQQRQNAERRLRMLRSKAKRVADDIAATKALLAETQKKKADATLGQLKARVQELTGRAPDIEIEKEGSEIYSIWVYHPGFTNSAMGPGCHLLHEPTYRECLDILKDGLTVCQCGDCTA